MTPHAAFLALRWAPDAVMENLANLADDFDIYGDWGFRDSVNVDTGVVSGAYLSLDQGIVMAAIGNALGDDMLRDAFATKDVRKALRPVMGMETFGAGPRRAIDSRPHRDLRPNGSAPPRRGSPGSRRSDRRPSATGRRPTSSCRRRPASRPGAGAGR